MAFDVVLLGELQVPADRLEEWLATPASAPRLWGDAVARPPTTPEAVLLSLAEAPRAPHELVDVELEGATLRVACFVSQDSFLDLRDELAFLFTSAAPCRGTGSLTLIGYEGVILGEQLLCQNGQGRLTRLTLTAMQLVTASEAFAALERRIHERFHSLVGRLEPNRSGEPNPFTGRLVG